MIAGDKVILKATGEPALVLQTLGNGRSFCQLPPQARSTARVTRPCGSRS